MGEVVAATTTKTPMPGGAGGQALGESAAGSDGGGPGGGGGNQDLRGGAGSGPGGNGTSGVGGFGDGQKWDISGTLIPPTSWSPGAGGAGKSGQGGGSGAGGYGGGAGAASDNGFGGGGGGGAGSWAPSPTALNAAAPLVFTPSSNPNGSNGSVQIAHLAPSNSRPVLYRINVGGPQVAATDGGLPWGVDGEFRTDGGLEIKSTGEAIDLTDPSLEGAAVPEAVFQRQRFDTATVKWEFPVPEGDQIEIRLFVAAFNETPEPSFTFKVEGSNTSVAISPGELFRGVMAPYVATIEDGILDLELVPQGGSVAIQGSKFAWCQDPR